IAFIVSTLLVGQFVAGRRLRRERFSLWLSVSVAVAWALLVLWPGVLPNAVLVVALLVVGVGGGAAGWACGGARAANAAQRSGAASGVVDMGGFTAAVLIQLSVGSVLQMLSSLPDLVAYRWAFVPVLVLVVVGTLAQAWYRQRRALVRPEVG